MTALWIRRLLRLLRRRRIDLGFAWTPDHPLPAELAGMADISLDASAGKWGAMLDRSSTDIHDYRFDRLRSSVAFARQHGHRLRLHTGFWPGHFPSGLDAADKRTRIRGYTRHLQEIAREFGSEIAVFEVANEVIALGGQSLKDAPGYDPLTVEELATYFDVVRQVAPSGMKLAINEHSCEGGGRKLDALIRLVGDLYVHYGVKVQQVGLQSHFGMSDRPTPDQFAASIRSIRDTIGCSVALTEFDLRREMATAEDQAAVAADLLEAAIDAGAESITFWGWNARGSWLPARHGTAPEDEMGTPFDLEGQPTPMWEAMRRVARW